MKRRIYIGIGLLIAVVAAFLILKKEAMVPDENYPTAGSNIIVFGDSLVEGVGSTASNDFVSVLSRNVGVPIINAGFSGDTTTTALNRIQTDVLSQDPKIVIVVLGGNDFLRRAPREEILANMGIIIDRIKASGAAVVVVGLHVADFSDLAKEKRVSYVPNILKDILGDRSLMYDVIHPNDQGYKIMAARIEPYLREILNPTKK